MKSSDFYNFIIVGAGTAGLTAAIVAARKGHSVVVLEKGAIAGPKPRGESMAHYPLLDEILGEGYLQSMAEVKPSHRVYHSPGDIRPPGNIDMKVPYYFFEWRTLIDHMAEIAKNLGVKFLFNCEVKKPIEENNICKGVEYKKLKGKNQKVFGNVVLACDGYSSTIGSFYNVDYSKINCPIVKFLGDNANINIDKVSSPQLYFIPNGVLDYAPNFPPSVAYVFPIGGKKIEAGIMLRMTKAFGMKTVKIPNEEEIMEVWKHLKSNYPGFSDFFIGIKNEYEELSVMPNAGLVKNFILGDGGAILVGDSAGFVDANGSSGLYFGMKMAQVWVNLISESLIDNQFEWTVENRKYLTKQFKNSKIYKTINSSYKLIGLFEWMIFKKLRTGQRINRFWKLIMWLLQVAS
ncbi:MAG: NAD(P)/FAD-dependent oxidoreductase [Promethearchaeota archaeon]